MSPSPLGFKAASAVLAAGRGAFFASPDQDLPEAQSAEIAADDLLSQFGYVGLAYERQRILLLGINPGNGPRSRRSAGDEVAMPALQRFVENRTPEAFLKAQRAYRQVCEGWAVWERQCNELLLNTGVKMEDIAFTNALPWRTASQSAFAGPIRRKTATLYVRPLIDELAPRIIVAVGKKAAEILGHAGRLNESVVVWNSARALRPTVIAEREAAASKFAQLLSAP